jgi:uncharacterized protein with LGFP repeats
MRPLVRLLAVLVVVGASLLSPVATSTPAQQAQAADARQFDAGNIISDAVFFDGRAVDAAGIQDFLRSKRSSYCPDPAVDSSPCLSDFRMNTTNRAPDSLCAGYQGAAGETAATIIAKVAVSCRVNPRVLLVLLQKEMGFVTSSNPTAKMYTRAAGYGCPDNGTGTCDPSYEGLQNQLYRSGWQYQKYAATPASYSYRAGRNNVIQWDVPRTCGTSTVYIQNQATAGLYNYTPYRPNQAALNAGYGSGDDCSAYGNRNFWLYFTDWFGSTQHATGGAVVVRANAPDTRGLIGASTGNVICGLKDGGCFQPFQGGAIYWSPATGAQIVRGPIHGRWAGMQWETGRLGYPTGEQICGLKDGGCFQDFQRGAMYWTSTTGAQPVLGSIQKKWASTQWETGYLGYPTGGETCGLTGKGCAQQFQGGRIYWSPDSGSHIMVSGPIWNAWKGGGYERSSLGYPTGEQVCGLRDGGCFQDFQRGAVYWSSGTGARSVGGAIRVKWASTTWETGYLGYPTTASTCGLTGGGCYQQFQGGRVYWSSPTGAHAMVMSGAIWQSWEALGREKGLGYPTGDQRCGLADSGCTQSFQGGAVYSSASTPAVVVGGANRVTYAALGAQAGPLGYPTAASTCGLTGSGCSQQFQRGRIVWSPVTGAHAVLPGAVADLWTARGAQDGLGYPTDELRCGLADSGCTQSFQGGAVYSSASTPAGVVGGAIRGRYAALDAQAGPLGYPTGASTCGLANDGCSQQFQGGRVYWSPASGAYATVNGPVFDLWKSRGNEQGLGYPTGDQRCGLVDDGCSQPFQKGAVYASASTPATVVGGAIRGTYEALRAQASPLGYPTGGSMCGLAGNGCRQVFQGGAVVHSPGTGTHAVWGAFGKA